MKQQIIEIASTLDQAAYKAKAVQQISEQQTVSLSDAYQIQKVSLANRYMRGEKTNWI